MRYGVTHFLLLLFESVICLPVTCRLCFSKLFVCVCVFCLLCLSPSLSACLFSELCLCLESKVDFLASFPPHACLPVEMFVKIITL